MGRDQFFNAEQVGALGAGRMLMPDSSSDAIADAARDILRDDRYKAGAKRMAEAMAVYGGARAAAATLEELTAKRNTAATGHRAEHAGSLQR
jgi:UDP:flavonoid glycosyltransferase YjiC (YdhE family)